MLNKYKNLFNSKLHHNLRVIELSKLQHGVNAPTAK